MRRDEILRVAREAGLLDRVDCSDDYFIPADADTAQVEYFAELIFEEIRKLRE